MSTSDVIVVMGVSGSGKSSVGRSIAAQTGWDFIEGDAFLGADEREAFRAGTLPEDGYDAWLKLVGDWIDGYENTGRSAVVACSALKRHHRDVLREGRPDVQFCHVTAHRGVLKDRVGPEGAKHLRQDLTEMEQLGSDEPGVTVSSEGDADEIVRRALAALGMDPGHS
jgi:gluconokinase